MPVRLSIVQIGKGSIGATLVDQVSAQRGAIRDAIGVDLVYAGIAGRSASIFEADGLDIKRWRDLMKTGRGREARSLLREAAGLGDPKVLVDATADEGMGALYGEALAAGFHVVSCNKKPFAGTLQSWKAIRAAAREARRFLLNEVTVGAGLPVIGTLRDLIDSGDRVVSIEGCFSGTLNFLCAALDRGERFSEALRRARDLGYTEPDPREDLSGQDVARKALILAREAGVAVEPEQVRLEPFGDVGGGGDVAAFLARAAGRDESLARSWKEAGVRGHRWRYVARVDGGCGAQLREVPADSPLGRLAGPENIFAFTTSRYPDQPLVVSGPGAGPMVTAAGAFGDILRVARAAAMAAPKGRA